MDAPKKEKNPSISKQREVKGQRTLKRNLKRFGYAEKPNVCIVSVPEQQQIEKQGRNT